MSTLFKSILPIAILFLVYGSLSFNAESATDNPYRVVQFNTTGTGSLSVSTSGGGVNVQGSEGHQVRVEMFVRRGNRNLSPDDTDLKNYEIIIDQRGNEIIASARRTGSASNILTGRTNESISFSVYVPKNFTSDLATSGGTIRINNLNGSQKIRTSGGSLNIENINGAVEARTSGGSISVKNCTGNISASTSGGSISASELTGIINLKTSGGSIQLGGLSGKVEASTSGGSINARINQVEELLSLSTSGGNISVSLPSNTGIALDLRGSRVETSLENFTGTNERNNIQGKMNGGGPMVKLRTSGGTVRLSFE